MSRCPAFGPPVCDHRGDLHQNNCFFEYAQCVELRQNGHHLAMDMSSPRCQCNNTCQNVWEPVCDNDGMTHNNLCSFLNAKCFAQIKFGISLTVDYVGTCCDSLCQSKLQPYFAVCDTDGRSHRDMCAFYVHQCREERKTGRRPMIARFGAFASATARGFEDRLALARKAATAAAAATAHRQALLEAIVRTPLAAPPSSAACGCGRSSMAVLIAFVCSRALKVAAMGCCLSRCCDRRPVDPHVHHYWRVTGALIKRDDERLETRGAGIAFINNGLLCYDGDCSRPFELQLDSMENVKPTSAFHDADNTFAKPGCGSDGIVDILAASSDGRRLHIGFKAVDCADMSDMLMQIVSKHRQKPKIFQFNSVDIDGTEIEDDRSTSRRPSCQATPSRHQCKRADGRTDRRVSSFVANTTSVAHSSSLRGRPVTVGTASMATKLLRRRGKKKTEEVTEDSPGVLAVWTLRSAVWRTNANCGMLLPRVTARCRAYVKYADLKVKGTFCRLSFPLVTIRYIEVVDCNRWCSFGARTALDIRGREFRLLLKGAAYIDDMCERLRFLVVRQRVPHSLRDLPCDWLDNADHEQRRLL
uniref:Kazal-like domain-containing protein n=1 Tax=Plectus sambesii TaxID=2011161 RepID=A0A914VWH0_9BILA